MSESASPHLQQSLAGVRAAVVNWRDLEHRQAGGAERYAWEYARALAERGAQVDFVTARDAGQTRRATVDGIRIIRRGGAFTFYPAAAWYFLSRRRRLDVVIDPECGIPVFSPVFLRRKTAIVLIVHHIHLRQFGEYFPAPVAAFGRFLEGWLMPRVYRRVRTLAVSDSTMGEMRSELGWTGPIELLHNGANIAAATDEHGEPVVDAAPRDPLRLVALGRLVPHKRVDVLIELVGDLAKTHPGLSLDVLGRGPEEERLRALVAERGLQDVVHIHGFVSEETKSDLLLQASLQVCASDNEGWGQVVIETAACGVPTVARDVPGLRDSIVPGETGWLAEEEGGRPRPAEVLRPAIEAALTELSDPARAAVVRRACRAHASRFDWVSMRGRAAEIVTEELARTTL